MRGEEKKNRRSSGNGNSGSEINGPEYRYGKNGISKSRSLGIIILILGMFLFQVSVFVFEKIGRETEKGKDFSGVFVQNGAGDVECTADGAAPERGMMVEQKECSSFEFDPNTISHDSLCLLGFSSKQALSIIKYREKGGRFRKREDFSRMYVVSGQMYEKLSGYIVINERELGKVPESDFKRRPNEKNNGGQNKKFVKRDTLKKAPIVVDLNRADSAALVTLYGIGGYYAKKILEYRARLGSFYAPEQLMEISGIDSARYAGFAGRISADPSLIRRFSLDTAGKQFLMRHPYIGAYAARGIILMRERIGVEACTLENLVKERVISEETAKKLWYYVE